MTVRSGRLLYATWGYTTHDRRFVESAVEGGWHVDVVRFDGGRTRLEDRPLPPGAVDHRWEGSVDGFDDRNIEDAVGPLGTLATSLGPDVVHAGPLPTVAYAAMLAEIGPLIAMSWASDLLVDAADSKSARRRAAAAVAGADAVLVDAQVLADIVVDLGAEAAHVVVLPWGVDLRRFPFVEPDPRLGRLRLLSLRSLEPIYDIGCVLSGVRDAQTKMPDLELTLTIAGSGSQEHELRALADDLGIAASLSWIGRISEDDVSKLLASHDATVSASRSDGSSLSMLQSLATGRPVIVIDLPSNLEWVVSNDVGFTYPTGDPSGLGDAILRTALRDDPAAAARSCRRVIEGRADWEVNRRRVLRLYDRLSGRPAG
jgi:glycosyltransferase involved in cell wall biosynthesis